MTLTTEGGRPYPGGPPRPFSGQHPTFVSDATGVVSENPLDLVVGTPRFSLDKLATALDNPFLEAEFPPPCPWEGVSRVEVPVPTPRRDSSRALDLTDAFRSAVRSCIGDSGTVAVMYSGGLDSASVLVHTLAMCRAEGRRVIAFVWNLDDQFGVPTGQLTHRQVREMGLDCELRVLPVSWRHLPEPGWSPNGPRIDYYTRLHRLLVEEAVAAGAGVMLTGVGGDEVLAAWQFMTPSLIARRRWRDLHAYEQGMVAGGSTTEVLGEAAALAVHPLRGERAFDLYSALAYASFLTPLSRPVLTPRYAPVVRAAATAWLRARADLFAARKQTWAEASLWDSVYPLAYAAHPAGSSLVEASPFLEPDFVQWSLGLPLVERFRRTDGPMYHWYKALQLRLLPASYRAVAPTYKQSYSHIFRQYQLDVLPDDELVLTELGLLGRLDKRDLGRIHSRLPAALRNVEVWVRGALAAGAQPC